MRLQGKTICHLAVTTTDLNITGRWWRCSLFWLLNAQSETNQPTAVDNKLKKCLPTETVLGF